MDLIVLEKLLDLKEKWILTEAEFEEEKEKLKKKVSHKKQEFQDEDFTIISSAQSWLPWWAIMLISIVWFFFVLGIIWSFVDEEKVITPVISQEKTVEHKSMIIDLFWAKYLEKMSKVYTFVDKYMVAWTRNEKDKILWEMGNMLNKEITDLDVVLLYTLSEIYKKNEYWVDWKKDFGDEELIKLLKSIWSIAYSKLQTEENIVNRYNFMLIRAWAFGWLYMNTKTNEISLDDVRNIYNEYFSSMSQNELKIELEKFQLSSKKVFNIHKE